MRLKYFSFPKSYLHLIQFSFHEKTQVLFPPRDLLKIEKIMLKLENLKWEYFAEEGHACKLKSLSAVKFSNCKLEKRYQDEIDQSADWKPAMAKSIWT